ncbi:hypothetical protein MSG28_006204 [Choristoneura fumiferana]|uniref:Uncharacterized protein n=1 Tax=Choristoneura fumiferana TaxID=7141 RepID=A0ACC0JE46_CHOFU|nr:hypothetical protein MSG28_006204 [Choristoneura fumiferana]
MEPTRENNLSLQDCLNNPIKRFTPSVPTPVWDDVENRTTLVENDMFSPPPPPLTQPALSHSLNSLSGNMTRTPIPRPESVRSDNSVMSVPTPQAPPRISGDVALTPTHSAFTPQANPHSSMAAAKFLDFKIQNFIATGDLRFPVRLEALQQAHGQFTSYEPELFPGLVYRMVRPRVVLLIFVNGKIVFTGGKTRNDIHEALDIIYPILRSYRKN